MINPNSQAAVACVRDGDLSGWKAFSALLVYIQVTVHWICAVTLVVIYVKFRTHQGHEDFSKNTPTTSSPSYELSSSYEATPTDETPFISPEQEPSRDAVRHVAMSNKTILGTVITYATIVLFIGLTMFIVDPPESKGLMSISEIIYGIFLMILHAFFALCGLATGLICAIPQVRLITARSRAGYGYGSLSVLGLGLRVVAFAALGISQGLRFQRLHVDDSSEPMPVYIWFFLLGGPAVGFAALAVSQLAVLGVALRFGALRRERIHL